ncbi:MAG TPA: hypothetical protein VFE47_17505 [Tepidisphaeraceae bacterium]|nr:hypothetical protein [Tepidisphaeraceae bacterium]
MLKLLGVGEYLSIFVMTTYAIILRPIDQAVPAEVRLRRLLKAALRAYGLRCIDVRELPADQERTNNPRIPGKDRP